LLEVVFTHQKTITASIFAQNYQNMYLVLSPAKTLDEKSPIRFPSTTAPRFLEHSQAIMNALKNKNAQDLMALQAISLDLASTNFDRNQMWSVTDHQTGIKTALELFKGDVYQGLAIEDWTADDVAFANAHVGVLSGLYGLLCPTDGLLPYRLEMGTRMAVGHHANLYSIWKPLITETLNQLDTPFVLNLASAEYFKAIDKKKLQKPVIDVEFKDYKGGKYKVISFWAKRARGALAKWIVQNQVTTVDALRDFSALGYYFEENLSTEQQFIFHRNEQ
jgi:cytoplasmic iron level regulating protein YaaA (DUF328/UPF0246 family)